MVQRRSWPRLRRVRVMAMLAVATMAISACDPPTGPSAVGGGSDRVRAPLHASQRTSPESDAIAP